MEAKVPVSDFGSPQAPAMTWLPVEANGVQPHAIEGVARCPLWPTNQENPVVIPLSRCSQEVL
jgi:hypothetical protein